MWFISNKDKVSELYNSIIVLLVAYSVVRAVILPYVSISVFIAIVLIFMFISLRRYLIVRNFQRAYLIDQSLIYFYILYQIIVIIRGLFFNYSSLTEFITSSFTNPYSTFALLLPFVVFISPSHLDYRFLKKAMVLLIVIFIYVLIDNYEAIFYKTYILRGAYEGQSNYGELVGTVGYVTGFFTLTSFLLFIPKFISKKIWYIDFACLLISIIIVAIGARRSSIAYMAMIAIGAFYFYNNTSKNSKILSYLFIGGILSFVVYYIASNLDSSFVLLQERGLSNSRETVEGEFWRDMSNGYDWIFGRGLNGTYYGPSTQNLDSSLSKYRNLCETGYLNIILTGGIVSLVLYILVLLRAAWRGWFRTNNTLTKSFSAFIIVSVISLIPFGLLSFSLTYFIVWVGVAVCNNPYYLSLTDEQVKDKYFK